MLGRLILSGGVSPMRGYPFEVRPLGLPGARDMVAVRFKRCGVHRPTLLDHIALELEFAFRNRTSILLQK